MLSASFHSVKGMFSRGLPGFLCRGTYRIGVDWGSRFIKVVILRRKGRQWHLKDWYVAENLRADYFPDPKSFATNPLDQVLKQKIKACLDQYIGFNPTIGISVPGSRVLIKTLSLPVMSEEEVREHLTWELDRYIATEMGEVLWDIHCCPPGASSESPLHQQVLLAVAQKDFIEKKISKFHDLGAAVGFVDIDLFALVNVVTYNYGPEERWLLAHLGPSGVLLAVVYQEEAVYLHEVPFEVEWYGDLVDQFRSKKDISTETGMGKASEEVLLEPFLDEVKHHIQEALRVDGGTQAPRPLAGVLLSGGFSVIEGMPSKLSQELGLPVTRIDPLKKMMVPAAIASNPSFTKAVPLLGVAVGMAFRDP